ncbi:uncharacterized protein [Palaemon carinicauda]|uniref:uncharacterized protein n=1 Tax=Palaemon carinicauda TaxID=392227 RepID=UPI0035B58229
MKDKTMKKNKNKGDKGKKWVKGKESDARKEMEQITQDPRFSHVPFDPKFRDAPKKERTVMLDSRFSSMFTDEKFHEKSTMDPRGRTASYSTKEDLRQFYRTASGDSASDSEEEEKSEEEEEITETTPVSQDASTKCKEVSSDILERLQDMTQDYARGAVMFSDDSSDDDSSSEEEVEREKEFDWGELDQDAIWDTQQEFEETSRIAVCNLDWNHIKAVDIMVVFHSFCPRGGSVKKVTIYPSEFGKERMAEEDRFGPKELTTETVGENNQDIDDNDIDLDKLEKGKLTYYRSRGARENYEALRRYERNRLRYYYAVVECDSVDTAKVLYGQCDRQSFERAGVYMDLRYIPSEMTFDDEEPHDVCEAVPEFYEAKMFTTTALFDSQPTLTWDQTDPHRQKVLSNAMRSAMTGKEYNENYLKNFIASSSDEDSDHEQEEDYSSDEGENDKKARIANFRALLQEIDEKETKKKNRFDMEEVFGTEGKEDEGEDEEESESENDLNPFERYLEKKKNKKLKKLEAKKVAIGEKEEYSDDELPEGMEDIRNDPFFAEELEESPKKDKKDKKKKKKKMQKEVQSDNEEAQKDLELLLMDEDQEEKRHFNMRDIVEEHKGKSKKKLKKNAKKKMAEKLEGKDSNNDFKVDTTDSRFSSLFTSGDFNIDPSHPQFKRTKAIDELINNVQKKRMAESFENTLDPKRVNTAKGKEDHELSMLVKRVKNKAKKPK